MMAHSERFQPKTVQSCEFDTNRQFETLNGVRAGGGAIQGPGPTIVGGMLYLNSGYGDHLGRPGNVLLAFSVEE